MSASFLDLLDVYEHQVVGRSFEELVHEDDRAACRGHLATLRQGATVSGVFTRVVRPRGGVCWVRWSANSTPDGRVALVARDVTPQMATRRRLLLQVEQLRLAGTMAKVGHWTVDLATSEVTWSAQVFEIFGLDPALGVPPLEDYVARFHPDDVDGIMNAVTRLVRQSEPFSYRGRVVRPDGSVRHVEILGPTAPGRPRRAAGQLWGVSRHHRGRFARAAHPGGRTAGGLGRVGGRARARGQQPAHLPAGVQIDATLAGATPWVQADRNGLTQVLLQLLAHVIDGRRPAGVAHTLRIRGGTSPQTSWVEIRSHDSGPDAPAMRAPAGPLDSPTDDPLGSGLGLELCQAFLTAVGGRLELGGDDGAITALVTVPLARAPAVSAR